MAHASVLSITETQVSTAGDPISANLPGTYVADDLLIILGAISAETVATDPSGWSKKWSEGASGQGYGGVWVKKALGTEGSSVSFDLSASDTGAFQVYRIDKDTWSGNIADVEVSGDSSSSNSSTPNSPSLTMTWGADDNLVITFAAARDDDATVTTYPTNYTNGTDTVSGGGTNNGATVATARREVTGATEDPGAFTLSESERWRSCTIGIKPAAATYKMEGTTKDNNGNALGSCHTFLCKDNGDSTASYIAYQLSNASTGAYSFTGLTDNDSTYFVISWKDDTPHVMDCTDHVLQPVLE